MSKKIYTYSYILMIIGYVLDYSINFSRLGAALKYLCAFFLLSSLITKKINFKKYISLFSLLIPFFVLPLILTIVGKYVIAINSVLIYSSSYILFVLLTISVIELFPNIQFFCKVTNFSIVIPLIVNVIISGGFSFKIQQMILNMVENTRVDRAVLGFSNPNAAGLIATMGLVIVISQFLYRKFTILNIACAVFYLLVIINTGSRTALFSPFIALLILGTVSELSKISGKIRIVLICFVGSATILYFYYALLSKGLNFDFDSLNKLTSYRFERQIATLKYLSANDLLMWGVGNINSTGLYSSSVGPFLNTDNSPIYFIVTIGVVGFCQVAGILIWILSKLTLNNKVGFLCFLIMIITSLFEHTLFVSTSLFSLLFLGIIYISINEKSTLVAFEGEKL